MAGGIAYFPERKEWGAARLKVDDKFLIRRPNEEEKAFYSDFPDFFGSGVDARSVEWVVLETGEFGTNFGCNMFGSGVLKCEAVYGSFMMDPQTLRFLSTYEWGYIGGE